MSSRLVSNARRWPILLLLIALVVGAGCSRQPLTVSVDLTEPTGQVIQDKFTMLNAWHYDTAWSNARYTDKAAGAGARYPFLAEVQLMTATGGCYTGYPGCPSWAHRDLFIHAGAASSVTDYYFAPLVAAVKNIVHERLRPYIVIGNVPLKMTSEPHLGTFNVNTMPPDDYEVHAAYIRALATEFVAKFGLEEVRSWRWGVLTEYENADWFYDGVSAESTKEAFFILYDTTVAALGDVLGPEHLTVGAHAMAVAQGLWDPAEFLDHVAFDTNYATGTVGSRLDFLSVSYYDSRPGKLLKKDGDLATVIGRLRERAEANGLHDLPIGVDEGRLLSGVDKKPLFSRAVAATYQGAYDAKKIMELHDLDVAWFSVWGVNTNAIAKDGLPTVSSHVFDLAHRMAGATRLPVHVKGRPDHKGNDVGGLAGYNEQTNTLHLMLYNFAPDPKATAAESPSVTVRNVAPIAGDTVTVTTWYVDDNNGNFWPTWWEDVASKLPDTAYNEWSAYSVEAGQVLTDAVAKRTWQQNQADYRLLAELIPITETVPVTDNTITLSPVLEHHGVVFYEVTGLQLLPTAVTNVKASVF